MAYASGDSQARVVFLQDGVYAARSWKGRGEACVLRDDASRRGLGTEQFPSGVRTVSYDDLVGMMEKEKVVSFL